MGEKDAVATARRAENAMWQGMARAKDCRDASNRWGTETPRPSLYMLGRKPNGRAKSKEQFLAIKPLA
jgi:hypothetical protein